MMARVRYLKVYYQASEYFFMIQIKTHQIINFTLSNQCKYLVRKFADISKGRIGKTNPSLWAFNECSYSYICSPQWFSWLILVVIFRLRSHSKIFNKLFTIFWPIRLPYSNPLRGQVMHLLINIFTGSPYWGPFKNYVDKILTIFNYLPTST